MTLKTASPVTLGAAQRECQRDTREQHMNNDCFGIVRQYLKRSRLSALLPGQIEGMAMAAVVRNCHRKGGGERRILVGKCLEAFLLIRRQSVLRTATLAIGE